MHAENESMYTRLQALKMCDVRTKQFHDLGTFCLKKWTSSVCVCVCVCVCMRACLYICPDWVHRWAPSNTKYYLYHQI